MHARSHASNPCTQNQIGVLDIHLGLDTVRFWTVLPSKGNKNYFFAIDLGRFGYGYCQDWNRTTLNLTISDYNFYDQIHHLFKSYILYSFMFTACSSCLRGASVSDRCPEVVESILIDLYQLMCFPKDMVSVLRASTVGTKFLDSNIGPNLSEFKFESIGIVYKRIYIYGCHSGARLIFVWVPNLSHSHCDI